MYSKNRVRYQVANKNTLTKMSATSMLKTSVVMMTLASVLAMTGCATSSLLEGDRPTKTTSKPVKQILIEDQLVAFGRPAQPLANMPSNSVVIVGEKQSYVLSQGGVEMANLLTTLTPQNIQVENDMNFYSPNNDGYFQGTMKLSYAKLKDEFKRGDYQYFLQHGGTDCTTQSDARINAQRFCFNVPVQGAIYPPVSNLSLIQSQYKALSKPYTVTFYGQTQQSQTTSSGANTGQKLVLLPFALAFDVVTLPLQILGAIAD